MMPLFVTLLPIGRPASVSVPLFVSGPEADQFTVLETGMSIVPP